MTMFFAAPMTVFAANTNYYIGGADNSSGTWYADLDTLIDDVTLADGDTITLLGNVGPGSETLSIPNINVTLNLGIYALTIDATVPNDTGISVYNGYLAINGTGTLNVTGGATYQGISITDNSKVTVNGATVNAAGGIGVQVGSAGSVGELTLSAGAINATSSTNIAVVAQNNSKVTISNATVTGTGRNGVYAESGAQVTVTGDVTSSSTATTSASAYAYNGGQIIVNGNATSTGSGSYGVQAYGSGSNITVTGSASGDGTGVYASNGGKATVGNAIGTGGDAASGTVGAAANGSGSLVTVINDVTSTSYGAFAQYGGQIIVDGTISAGGVYVAIQTTYKTITNFELVTTKAGYLTYTNGTSTVWVEGDVDVIDDFGTWTGSGTAIGEVDYDPASHFYLLAHKDKIVDPSNYNITSGSTVITLSEAYLSTLPNGNYTFTAFFYNAQTTIVVFAELNLTVNNPNVPGGGGNGATGGGANGVPQTSDINNTLLWTLVLALIALGVFGLIAWRKRQRA